MVQRENLFWGAIYILFASTAYAVMGLLVKIGSSELSNEMMVFMRNAVCLLIIMPVILFPKPLSLKTPVLPTHFVRAAAGLLNMYCFFYSVRYILLADAVLLNNTMPLFVPFIVWIWTGKKISLNLIPGLILGFLGVIFILHPTKDFFFQLASLAALASGLFMAISMTGVRELSGVEPVFRILFYYFLISTVLSAIPLIWNWRTYDWKGWGILVAIGVSAAVYQFFLTKGYMNAPASKISPFTYFAVVLSGVFDWVFWKLAPDTFSFIGLILVTLGAIMCIRSGAKK